MLANRMPTSAIAVALNLSPRQTRKYVAEVKATWASEMEQVHVDRALARVENDAERARVLAMTSGIPPHRAAACLAVALNAERLLADLATKRTDLAARVPSHDRPMSDEEVASTLNMFDDFRELLALPAAEPPIEAEGVEVPELPAAHVEPEESQPDPTPAPIRADRVEVPRAAPTPEVVPTPPRPPMPRSTLTVVRTEVVTLDRRNHAGDLSWREFLRLPED
jgi:hypothetical protein